MKNKLDYYDLKQIAFIAERLEKASDLAEKETKRIMGGQNHSYELGFLASYVQTLGMELETIINK